MDIVEFDGVETLTPEESKALDELLRDKSLSQTAQDALFKLTRLYEDIIEEISDN